MERSSNSFSRGSETSSPLMSTSDEKSNGSSPLSSPQDGDVGGGGSDSERRSGGGGGVGHVRDHVSALIPRHEHVSAREHVSGLIPRHEHASAREHVSGLIPKHIQNKGLKRSASNVGRNASWANFLNTAGEQQEQEEHYRECEKKHGIDMSQLLLGTKFACGAYSRIYRGQYLGQEVAVKLVKQPEDDKDQARRLDRQYGQEISLMSRLQHDNIVKFMGATRTPPVFCVVTEYLAGGSLKAFLHKTYPNTLPMETVLTFALDVARGMEYLHSQGVLHLDLKSPNLILGEKSIVKVTDFGVARHESECLSMTPDCGTYRWMAPELISNKVFSMKADVYSFGIILWELMTGQTPYEDMSTIQAAFAVCHKNARPVIPDSCPRPLRTLMEECWAACPEKRPSFAQIVPRLEECQECLRRNELYKQCKYDCEKNGKFNKVLKKIMCH